MEAAARLHNAVNQRDSADTGNAADSGRTGGAGGKRGAGNGRRGAVPAVSKTDAYGRANSGTSQRRAIADVRAFAAAVSRLGARQGRHRNGSRDDCSGGKSGDKSTHENSPFSSFVKPLGTVNVPPTGSVPKTGENRDVSSTKATMW
jgi:hypothetical protein